MMNKKSNKKKLIKTSKNRFIESLKEFFMYYFLDFFSLKKWSGRIFFLLSFIYIVLSFIFFNLEKGLAAFFGLIISIPITFIFVYLVFILPTFLLSYKLEDIPKTIDELFADFNKMKVSDKYRITVLKEIEKRNITNETLSLWLYDLKCYKERLSTVVRPAFWLILSCIAVLPNYLGISESVIDTATTSFKQFVSNLIFSPKGFSLIWVLLVYYRELQETSERICKIELLKDIKNI